MTMEKSTILKQACALSMFDRPWLFILIASLSFSCGRPDTVTIPDETISDSIMVAILTDLHLVEGAKVGNKIMGDTTPAPVYFKKVYQKHGVSEAQFEEDFRFYTSNPKLMTEIYEQVIVNLSKIEAAPPREVMTDDITREQNSVSRPLSEISRKVRAEKKKKADSSKIQEE